MIEIGPDVWATFHMYGSDGWHGLFDERINEEMMDDQRGSFDVLFCFF